MMPPNKTTEVDRSTTRMGVRVSVQFAGVGLVGAGLYGGLAWAVTGDIGALLTGLVFYGAIFAVALIDLTGSFPHRVIGLCNVATTARLVLVAVLLTALVAFNASAWAVFCLAVVAFALDGLDGWLARREGRASAFGARFDMEVDSLLALVLTLLAWQNGPVGAYVLILGLPRYVFRLAQFPFPWLNGDLPERFSRKVVCVVQIAALIVALFPLVPALIAILCVGLAAVALVWSFWLDVRLLRRARG